jgi:carbon monoxide dehydrogenase subunit G
MEIKLDKDYAVEASAATAWQLLVDIPAVASCMPGAQISEVIDGSHFKGNVRVKVGPAVAAFAGEIEVLAVDAATQTLRLLGKGSDKGGSSASMELTATVSAAPDGHARLRGQANIIVNGKFAQFGGRMMGSVSDVLLAQFAATFSEKAKALGVAAITTADGAAAPVARSSSGTETAAAPRALNAGALLWSLLKNWLAGLFGRRG